MILLIIDTDTSYMFDEFKSLILLPGISGLNTNIIRVLYLMNVNF